MKSVIYTIGIVWEIRGFGGFGFGSNKRLYNLKTGRERKQSINNGTIGYWFGKKFVSIKRLRLLLYKPKQKLCPF